MLQVAGLSGLTEALQRAVTRYNRPFHPSGSSSSTGATVKQSAVVGIDLPLLVWDEMALHTVRAVRVLQQPQGHLCLGQN